MHPLLENFSMFSWSDILETEEKCMAFLEDLELIPKKEVAIACPACSGSMSTMKNKTYKTGWQWICKNPKRDQKPCSEIVKPLENTVFENCRIPLRDFVGIVFAFVLNMGIRELREQSGSWRRRRRESRIGTRTILDIYSKCKKIGAVAAIHYGEPIEEPEKAFDVYRKNILDVLPSYGDQVHQFLMDAKSVYPGYGKKGLALDVFNLSVMSSLLSTSLNELNISTENLNSSISSGAEHYLRDESVSSTENAK